MAREASSAGCMIFPIGTSGQRIVFADPVLKHFDTYRQTRWYHREAGGQLFARFDLPEIVIVEATGPRKSDRRYRYSYQPNREAEQREIEERHPHGLHFAGDWHTHPEDIPEPSSRDEESMREVFERSDHRLNGFLLVIVGRRALPAGLGVWLYSDEEKVRLRANCICS